jgi:ubiquinone/menaquinone biosynthesis C-methylase UbiE
MGLYDKYVLPKIIDCACGQAIMQTQRQLVVPLATGNVLEIGIGSGLNLPFYDPAKVQRVIGVDPSAELLAKARERSAALSFPVELLTQGAEAITLADRSIDSALLTFTLCTVPAVDAALQQIRRVLKPGGAVIFCEHGKAPDGNVQRWQARLNPLWRRCFGGCNLNRDVPALLSGNGFQLERLDGAYLPDVPRFAGYRYLGVARAVA